MAEATGLLRELQLAIRGRPSDARFFRRTFLHPGMLPRHKGELMADKSKMSVADILAAARKADASGGASEKPSETTPQEVAPAEVSPAPTAETPSAPAAL